MRPALQRLLANPSAILLLSNVVHSDCACFCQHCYYSLAAQGQSRRYTAKENGREQLLRPEARTFRTRKLPAVPKGGGPDKLPIKQGRPDAPKARARLPNVPKIGGAKGAGLSRSTARPDTQITPLTQQDLHSSNVISRVLLRLPSRTERNNDGWRIRLVTLEQYQHESNLEALNFQGSRLVDNPSYAQNWELWLELMIFRRRHHGSEGTLAIYKEIFRRDLQLPTQGCVANQLWGLLIQAGSGLLEEIVLYASRLKWSTGRSWSEMYYGIISITLKNDPDSAYKWHVKLKDDFPPSLKHYEKIFKLSLERGCSVHFRDLYKDTPLIGMYRTVIRHLCRSQMYAEALKWHDLLCEAGDFPAVPAEIQPLLNHLVSIGDQFRFEKVLRQLVKNKGGISNVAENLDQRDTSISREIINRKLGEIHGVAPKRLSDEFCARIFATRLFSVDTIIQGLQIMAAEVIGPLSLREMAVRDNCDPGTICYHMDALRNAGISFENSAFCTVIRSLAVENKRRILASVVNCDLHPDTFSDNRLQERLLAQYYEENDLLKVERTLAILTTGCLVNNLQLVQRNLNLRCQITLGRREEVLATLEEMQRMGIPVTPRSSRHLRICWLSRRQVGRGPETTGELTILIKASQMTMQSGRLVPLIAWREILRRLGMAGRLTEFENLALWLVDWYSSPAVKAALSNRIPLSGLGRQKIIKVHMSPGLRLHPGPQRFLKNLFTLAAQQAIVAWGFQHFISSRKSFIMLEKASYEGYPPRLKEKPPFQWTWGLRLLRKLRERGLYVKRGEVARMCIQRLNTLFGTRISKRKINRRARAANSALRSYTESLYVRQMEKIWGKSLFVVWHRVEKNLEKRQLRACTFDRWRRFGKKTPESTAPGKERIQEEY